MKKFASLILVLLTASFGMAILPSEAAVQKGKGNDANAVFQAQCAKCHGADGQGIPSLPDIPNFTDAKWQASRTDKQISDSINNGTGIMPGYKSTLSAAQIRGLVGRVRAFGKK